MKKGFVFGKFMPFHNGHKAMIDFALTKVDSLYVIVCASDKEDLPLEIRAKWIAETYPSNKKIEIIKYDYVEDILPNSSVPNESISALWAVEFSKMMPDVDVVITSEGYGEMLAKGMGIRSILFDKERSHVPVSATSIRSNIVDNWSFIPDPVKRYYQKKVVLLGTECTGKSSLSKALFERLNSSLVEEAGREIIEDSKSFSIDDLYKVVEEHALRIENAKDELKPFVIIDTDVHITLSYAKFEFGSYLDEVSDEIFKTNRADYYFYLTADFPYIDDGTRLPLAKRNLLDKSHKSTLKDYGLEDDVIEIKGDWNERLSKMIDILSCEPDKQF